jgi:hypothetical protein
LHIFWDFPYIIRVCLGKVHYFLGHARTQIKIKAC